MSYARQTTHSILKAGKDSLRVSRDLYVIMVPVILLVKILQEYDLIQYAALPLQPIMELVGLPTEMGIAWAAALLNNVYSGLIVFLQIAQENPESLTTAHVTTLGGMMLIAHAIPVECGIARRCRSRFLAQVIFRISTAILFGIIVHNLNQSFGYLGDAGNIPLPFEGSNQNQSITSWALSEGQKLLWISLIIFTLINIMNFLNHIGIIGVMNTIIGPLMRLIGISHKAGSINVIGLTLGLSYGSGIIIQEARKGELSAEDIFFSLSFMGICHSLIEDVLLVALVGGDVFTLLILRSILCFSLVALMVPIVRSLPDSWKTRYLWLPQQNNNTPSSSKELQ